MLEYTPLPAYFEQFKLLLLVLLVLLVCAPCICCGCGLAAVTAPCWLFVLLITSPIWIAALACGAATLVLVLVGLVVFKDALPPAQRAAVDEWQFWAQATLLRWNLRAVLYGTGLGPLAEVGLTYLDRVDLEAWRRTIREWDVEGMQLRIVELVEKGAAVVGVKPADLGIDVVAMFARPAAARSAVADGDDDDAPVAAVERVDEPDDAGDAPPVAVASPSEARP